MQTVAQNQMFETAELPDVQQINRIKLKVSLTFKFTKAGGGSDRETDHTEVWSKALLSTNNEKPLSDLWNKADIWRKSTS